MRLEHLLSGAVPLMAGQALQEAPGDDATEKWREAFKKQLPPGAVLRAVLQQWRREMNTRRDWSFLKKLSCKPVATMSTANDILSRHPVRLEPSSPIAQLVRALH